MFAFSQKNSKSKKFTISGWNDHIKPYADDSKFWYQLWQASGRPNYGEIFINMRLSRRQFKYAVRRLKRCQEKIQNEKFIKCLLANEGDVFQEIKKLRAKSKNFSNRIDDQVGANAIAQRFASIYENLYNKVELGNKVDQMKEAVHSSIDEESQIWLNKVNEALIKKVVDQLKPDKKDSVYDISSDFYLNAPPELIIHLTHLIRIYFSHGFIPQTV